LAMAALLSGSLTGCATRPGPELLTPVAASPGGKPLNLYVATTRERASPSQNVFTANRANTLNFGKFALSVPPGRKPGSLHTSKEAADSQQSFVVVSQTVMSEAEFQNIVAPKSARQRKKQNVLVFVHGFNNTFQEALFQACRTAGRHEI
jgi:esterase/lipase superfamily enzyme